MAARFDRLTARFDSLCRYHCLERSSGLGNERDTRRKDRRRGGIAVREERQGDHVGIVGGVGGGEQPSEVFIASSPAPVTINARTRPCEGMRMSVRPSCDHVAAQVGTVRADLS